jgi:hypothetical protein
MTTCASASAIIDITNLVARAVWNAHRPGSRKLRDARVEAVYVCVIGFNLSRRLVARHLGLQHSSTQYFCNVIEDRREADAACEARLQRIGALLGVQI